MLKPDESRPGEFLSASATCRSPPSRRRFLTTSRITFLLSSLSLARQITHPYSAPPALLQHYANMNSRPAPSPPTTLSPASDVVLCLFYNIATPQTHQQHFSLVALAQAPFLHHRVADTSFLICAEEFFEDNPLIAATLQPCTQQKYAVALENFRTSSFASPPYVIPLDHRLCMYIQNSYTKKPTPGNRQEMASLLCMILIMYPFLRGANLRLSKRCLSGWRSLQPSKSSAPFTKTVGVWGIWLLLA